MNFEQLKTAFFNRIGASEKNTLLLKLQLNSWQQLTVDPNGGFSANDGGLLNNTAFEFTKLTTEYNFIEFANQFLTNELSGNYEDWIVENHTNNDIEHAFSVDLVPGTFDYLVTFTVTKVEVLESIIITTYDDKFIDIEHPSENPRLYQIFNPLVRYDAQNTRLIDSIDKKSTFIKTGQYDVLIDGVLYDKATTNADTLRTKLNEVAKKASLFFLNSSNQFIDSVAISNYYDELQDFTSFELIYYYDNAESVEIQLGSTLTELTDYTITGLVNELAALNGIHTTDENGKIIKTGTEMLALGFLDASYNENLNCSITDNADFTEVINDLSITSVRTLKENRIFKFETDAILEENTQYKVSGLTGIFEDIIDFDLLSDGAYLYVQFDNYKDENNTFLEYFLANVPESGVINGNFTIQKFNPNLTITKTLQT